MQRVELVLQEVVAVEAHPEHAGSDQGHGDLEIVNRRSVITIWTFLERKEDLSHALKELRLVILCVHGDKSGWRQTLYSGLERLLQSTTNSRLQTLYPTAFVTL